MSDDRFNSDNDLPDWLKGDDDSDAANAPEDEGFAWQSDSESGEKPDSSRLGVTGQLPWRQGISDDDDPRASQLPQSSSLDDVDWDALGDASSDDEAAVMPTDGVPDWLSNLSEDVEPVELEQPDTAPEPEIEASEDVPDWIGTTAVDASDSGLLMPTQLNTEPQQDITAMPDWLSGADVDDAPPEEVEDDLFAQEFSSAIEEAGDSVDDDSSIGLRRVAADNPQIRKLGDKDNKRPEDMTYEEWERYQQQQEMDQQRAQEIELESEVPDWFRDNVEIGDAERSLDSLLLGDMDDEGVAVEPTEPAPTSDANFVPEWFLGLEEQNLDESPEWVREATASTDISGLTDTTAFELPSFDDIVPEDDPPLEASAPDDFFATAQPDFVSADAPASGTDDLDAMFEDMVEAVDDEASAQDDMFGDMFAATAAPTDDAFDNLFDAPTISDSEPDWLQEAETAPSQAAVEDDFFTQLDADAVADGSLDDDWLGGVEFDDVADDDFLETAAPQQPINTPAPSAQNDFFMGPKQTGNLDDALSDILGDTGEERRLARDDSAREVLSHQSDTDISDLFEGVDDDFLEALSSSGPMGEVSQGVNRLSGAALFEGPEWVEELRPDEQIRLGVGGVEIEFDQRALTALPENVRQLRAEAVEYTQTAEERESAETIEEGTLAGITGGLAQLNFTQPNDVVLATGVQVTEQQEKRIELLNAALDVSREEIRTAEADDAPDAAAKPRRRKRRRTRSKVKPDRLLIAVAMLVAVMVPFLSDSFHIGDDPDTTELNIQQATVLAAIDSLQPNDRVLVAFEYGPTAAGELNPLAEAVLRDILAQEAVPIALSTNFLGALNGRNVLDTLATDEPLLDALERDRLTAGEDYYTLRYIAGGPIGIRALSRSVSTSALIFSTDSSGEDTNLNIGRVDAGDFALVLVIGETSDDVRNWAEQFEVEGLPKFALVTTAIEPVASAYTTEDPATGYQGYLSGYRDTYRYNILRNAAIRDIAPTSSDFDIPDTELSQWHSLSIGALSAAGIIILGTLLNLLRSLVRGRRS